MSELYLKDKKVLTLKDIDGIPREVQRIDNPELLPPFLKDECTTERFNKWLEFRTIPERREGFDVVKQEYGESWLENKNYASLTDQYWIKKRTETWRKINFFTNTYNKTIGNMFFLPWDVPLQRKYDNNSPDLTTGGLLMKRWIQNVDKTSALVKAGSIATHQEPLSEVLVSVLAEQLNIVPCVKYDMWIEGVTICSRCDNFITIDTELVPASHVYKKENRAENESVYHHLIKTCEDLEIPGAKEFIDGMIFLDNITGNEDRNLGNIGFIRDSNTLKYIGPAPLFDSGNAYWSTKKIGETVKSKLFGDIEHEVFKKLHKQCDMSILKKNDSYKKLIGKYPGITDEKKVNLIDAISKRNNKLVLTKNMDMGLGR